jgi:hypothetical protein
MQLLLLDIVEMSEGCTALADTLNSTARPPMQQGLYAAAAR